MGRLIGFVLLVAAVYFGMNYVTASGPIVSDEAAERTRSTPQRAGDSVRNSFAEGNARLEKLLPE